MNSLNIRALIDESIDFIKAHYEYILPFSLFYLLIQLPPQFIPQLWFLPLFFFAASFFYSLFYA